MISKYIIHLVDYGLETGLIDSADKIYVTNRLLELFELDELQIDGAGEYPCGSAQSSKFSNATVENSLALNEILDFMLDYSVSKGILESGTIVSRDLFDTRIMAVLTPNPSVVISNFNKLNAASPKDATDYFYKFSQDTNYIRRDRIAKDIQWKADTPYGELDVTINLSKPEKDPKDIAAERNARQSGYPKCLLCMENEGYSGRINHPARQNHRIIPIRINNQDWGFQYSPYVYYNEHCIIFNSRHIPMQIDKDTFVKLFDFVKLFPHYFVGSNADLPIVGGSILSHDHFQGGNYEFAMAKAQTEKQFKISGFEDVDCGIVKWPMSVIRLRHTETAPLIKLACHILDSWRAYSNPDSFIFAYTGDTPHNTITPIARKNGDFFEMDIVLRNNITTREHPMGVYHPHEELHNIKKENIGLIEVMGLAVLPSRLKSEMKLLADAVIANENIGENENIAHHKEWIKNALFKHADINQSNIEQIIQAEIGKTFSEVLSHSGVFKRDEKGQKAFEVFMKSLNT
ncbi:MAG: UDP-glucose--hexose-1-phosphate uridylyltransferase [Proteocatella sp.]